MYTWNSGYQVLAFQFMLNFSTYFFGWVSHTITILKHHTGTYFVDYLQDDLTMCLRWVRDERNFPRLLAFIFSLEQSNSILKGTRYFLNFKLCLGYIRIDIFQFWPQCFVIEQPQSQSYSLKNYLSMILRK